MVVIGVKTKQCGCSISLTHSLSLSFGVDSRVDGGDEAADMNGSMRNRGYSSDSDDSDNGDDPVDAPEVGIGRQKRLSSTLQSKKRKKKRRLMRDAFSLLDDEAMVDDDDPEEVYDEESKLRETELTAFEKEAHERVRRRQEMGSTWADNIAMRAEARAKVSAANALPPQTSTSEGRYGNGYDREMSQNRGGNTMHPPRRKHAQMFHASVRPKPSVNDSKLFLIKCTPRKENMIVMSLMNKTIALQREQGEPTIKSAIATGTSGVIYIEADAEPDVRHITSGMHGLYHGSLMMVPLKDMTAVLEPKANRKLPVEPNIYVRLRRRPYKDDLAYVERLVNFGEKVLVRYIPRIDISALSLTPEQRKSRGNVRPPQRWFNALEVDNAGGLTERRKFPVTGESMDWFDGNFFRNGYAVKEMSLAMVRSTEVHPTLDELTKFRSSKAQDSVDEIEDDEGEGGEGSMRKKAGADAQELILKELQQIHEREGGRQTNRDRLFAKGDNVLVIAGDLKDLTGKIVEVIAGGRGGSEGTVVRVQPFDEEVMNEIVDVLACDVTKQVAVGAHVRVIEGMYAGETGTVVNVKEGEGGPLASTAVVMTDMSAKEIQVLVAHLQETLAVAQGLDNLQGYELYDLITLGANEVACITGVGREDLEVVTTGGNVRRVKPEEARGKRNATSSRSMALDAEQNTLRCGNVVNIIEGRHIKSVGTIKHMHRAVLFMHSRTHQSNSGIFVVRARSCVLAGNKRGASQLTGTGYVSNVGEQKDNILRDSRNRHDELLGQTVKLIKGQYKGHAGMVRECLETTVKVELATKQKTITVDRDKIRPVGNKFGLYSQQEESSALGGEEARFFSAQTPMHGAQTPMHGAQTPMHGSQTPMHGTQTPLHGARTPLYGSQPSYSAARMPLHAPPTPGHGDSWRPQESDVMDWGSSNTGGFSEMGTGSGGAGSGGYTEWDDNVSGGTGPTTILGSGGQSSLSSTAGVGSFGGNTGNVHQSTSDGGFGIDNWRMGGHNHDPSSTVSQYSGNSRGSGEYTPFTAGGTSKTSSLIQGAPLWGQPGMVVMDKLSKREGHVVDASSSGLTLRMGDGVTRSVHADQVTAVRAQKGNRIRIIKGEHEGLEGRVAAVDGVDVVVKVDGGAGIESFYVSEIAKLA